MKYFLAILIGSALGQVTYISATYNLYPPDPGSYLSFSDNILVALAISLITAAVFFGFFKSFKVKSENVVLIGVAALLTQLVSWGVTLLLSDWGGIVLIVDVLVFSAIANFLLDRLVTSQNSR